MNNIYYVIIAYRWGRADDSYLVDVTLDKDFAIELAKNHTLFRGGKYGCQVYKVDESMRNKVACQGYEFFDYVDEFEEVFYSPSFSGEEKIIYDFKFTKE